MTDRPSEINLPKDRDRAILVGRIWSERAGGPVPVMVRDDALIDLSTLAPTMSMLCERENLATELRHFDGPVIGQVSDIFPEDPWRNTSPSLRLLAPIDLQCIKACGVTFAVSVLERIVEERAGGDLEAADKIRTDLKSRFGEDTLKVKPGSPEAEVLKQRLISEKLWSPYLEVAIGRDAEVFTKAPVLSAVTWGDEVGIRDDSVWNNPEPEIVLICNSHGRVMGATLGNDVNLRDFEGRSALLLGKAKDNNASTSLGPFIRLFDSHFGMEDLLSESVSLSITGADGFRLVTENSMRRISRHPEDLVRQTCGRHHQYPDGFALFLGSLFAPIHDRDGKGQGFTHHLGDIVEISAPSFGRLVNRVNHSAKARAWSFGITALMQNLAKRNLLV